MKIDFTKPLLTFKTAEPILKEDKTPALMCDAILEWLLSPPEKAQGQDKAFRYKLARKIEAATPETEYKVEELKLIKQVTEQYASVVAAGQIYALIDGSD